MATTRATTTKSNRPAAVRHRAGRLRLALIALLVATPLLILGMPRLSAALLVASQADTVSAVERGDTLPPSRLREAIERLDGALRWYPTRRTHLDLAALHQALAEQLGERHEAHRSTLDNAVAHLRAGLALGPLSPLAWTRLGWLLAQRGEAPEALEAVHMSTLIAAHAPRQQWWRLELWLRLLGEVGEEQRPLLRRQLAAAFEAEPQRLVKLATHYRALYRIRGELEAAGLAATELNLHFPIPLSLSRSKS